MRPVLRDEIVDYVTYNDLRDSLRPSVLEAKRLRRYRVGPYLCLLFENRETVRYQVQEMMRTERIVRDKDIQHELRTYNELLGENGRLGCTLLIGIDDPDLRDVKLTAWLGLNPYLYLRLSDGQRVRPTWDERQMGDDRLSAVQYLHFETGGVSPVALGCDHDDPDLHGEYVLSDEERAALRADLDEA
jgi:hypothetical protein